MQKAWHFQVAGVFLLDKLLTGPVSNAEANYLLEVKEKVPLGGSGFPQYNKSQLQDTSLT